MARTNIPLVDLKAQYRAHKAEIDASIQRVLDASSFILGPEVERFESRFADYVGTRGAVGVASGTAALHLALLAHDIGPGDEVITVAHTFFATAEAISVTGATPVFVDVEPGSYVMDVSQVAPAITPRTRAVIAVHLYGQAADMDGLRAICDEHDLKLIEDAAQAHGAELGGRRCGALGDAGCFSFYPGKNLGGYGDGGLVTSDDEGFLERVRRLRNHGRATKYEHDEIGWGYRLDALQAAVLDVKMNHLEAWTEARRAHAGRYRSLLDDAAVVLPKILPGRRHVFHLFVVRTKHRDQVLAHLGSRGIGAGIHYPVPLHHQPAYAESHREIRLPVTEQVAEEVLSLPMYPELAEEQIERVAAALREAVQ